jgi:DNA-binding PadR family transcriptional regulator
VTVYTLDSEGRIEKSVVTSDDEPLGEITYTYSITKEGKAALVALKETS